MNKLIIALIAIILLLSVLIGTTFYCSGCGNGSNTVLPENTSQEFQEWRNNILKEYPSPIEFAENSETIFFAEIWSCWEWNSKEYEAWENRGLFEIYSNKKINCYLCARMLFFLYPGGELKNIEQPVPYSHTVYIWNGKIFSFGGYHGTVYESWIDYYSKRK